MELDGLIWSVLASVIVSVITGVIAGGVSSQRTIAGLIVHIDYLRSHVDRHEQAIARAHSRIDDLDRGQRDR